MSGTVFIGIDPGSSSGGIAANVGGVIHCTKLKDRTEADIRDFLDSVLDDMANYEAICVIERVGPARGRDGRRQGVSSAFSFGQSYGFLQGVIVASRIPYELVTPSVWQKAMGCLTKGDKNITKAAAQRMFPGLKVTHAVADALLLCEYARRTDVARHQKAAV